MDKRLSITYDREGDILHIDAVEPYAEQIGDFDDAGNIYMRLNPTTGAVENFEILFFSSYFHKLGDRFDLPFSAVFSPAESSEPLELPALRQ